MDSQKVATCACLFELLKGPVCAQGVHADPCKNPKKVASHTFFDAPSPGGIAGAIYITDSFMAIKILQKHRKNRYSSSTI